jgi:Flp pilus assembly protein TadD
MLVPVVGLVQVGAQAHADRYTYLPQIGLVLAVVVTVAAAARSVGIREHFVSSGFGLVVAILAALSVARVGHWRDSISLWSHALDVDPRNHVAHFALGKAESDRGRMDIAAAHYRRAVEIQPRYAEAWINLGFSSLALGRTRDGIDELQRALELQPDHARAHSNLCVALARDGRGEQGLSHCRRSLELDPNTPKLRENLGLVLLATGRLAEGRREYERAIAEARASGDVAAATEMERRLRSFSPRAQTPAGP